jgi:aminoglycoside phosphotransferase (APT) family kinase protein
MTESIGFWEKPSTDLALTAEAVCDLVRGQFPELPVATLERLGDGWEHQTYRVDGHVVFRFPRQTGGDYFESEERQHSLVSSVIGELVGIPRITFWGRPTVRFPCGFAGHELIPGVGANDPSVRLNPALADDIGRVLARLHAIPAAATAGAGVGTADVAKADLDAGLRRVRHWVNELPEIRREFAGPCAWLDSVRRPPDAYRGRPRFIHDDFQMEHVLVDATTGRLAGIIDWGAGMGDPARDFSYVFLHGGRSFFERAVAAYNLPLDAEFPDRTLFSGRLGALDWLAYAITHGGSTSRELATVWRVFELE